MAGAIFVVLAIYLGYTGWRLVRRTKPVTLHEYFSFGGNHKPEALKDSFFVTNASFSTAFVSITLFVSTQGVFAFVAPLAFVFGTLGYVRWILPRHMTLLSSGKRYPELLGDSTSSVTVRVIASMSVLISLWLFTYTEIQAFVSFLPDQHSFFGVSPLGLTSGILICLVMGVYTYQSGLSGVIANDSIQKWLIVIGALALTLLIFLELFNSRANGLSLAAYTNDLRQFLNLIFMAVPETFSGYRAPVFVVETFIGFFFAQLLYYDNWQRISAYIIVRKNDLATEDEKSAQNTILKEVTSAYYGAAWNLLLLYCLPVLTGFIALRAGTQIQTTADLVAFLNTLWLRGFFEKILLIFVFGYLISALVSTIEIYVVSISNNIVDDITGLAFHASPGSTSSEAIFSFARITSLFICSTFIPAILIVPDFQRLFIYIFYSANGLVGPLCMLLAQRNQRPYTIFLSLGVGACYPLISDFAPSWSSFFGLPGTITVSASLIISYCGSTRKEVAK